MSRLALRMWRTTRTSGPAPPARPTSRWRRSCSRSARRPGVVVECGCFMGGSTANLSLVCGIVGRGLIVYDSFEGLPRPTPGDRFATARPTGFLRADLDGGRARTSAATARSTSAPSARAGSRHAPEPHRADRPRASSTSTTRPASTIASTTCGRTCNDQGYLFIDEYISSSSPPCSGPSATGERRSTPPRPG